MYVYIARTVCSSRGTCNLYTGTCVCYTGFVGINCGIHYSAPVIPPYDDSIVSLTSIYTNYTKNIVLLNNSLGLGVGSAYLNISGFGSIVALVVVDREGDLLINGGLLNIGKLCISSTIILVYSVIYVYMAFTCVCSSRRPDHI